MNKVILLGRLTKEPEVKQTDGGATLCRFTLAVPRAYVKQGEKRESDFFQIIAWAKLGEFVGKYFHKGSQMSLIARLQNRSWDDEQGVKHYSIDIIAEETYFAGSKNSSENEGNNEPKSTGDADDGNYFQITGDDELPF